MGKRTAQKNTIINIAGDSQVNSNFPYWWSPASLTFNNYFYLFLYLYITRLTIINNAHLFPIQVVTGKPNIKHLFYLFFSFISSNNNKTLPHTTYKTTKQTSRLGTASDRITVGLALVLGSALVQQKKKKKKKQM